MIAPPPAAGDCRWMSAAINLAGQGLGRVWPNPSVGCVIVRNGRLVGRAVTAPGGRPHAETRALAMAGPDGARGATVYVTLEPCAHQGRTPPCTQALIDAQVARVVIAVKDPDPRVNGAGIARLKQAGVTVETGVLQDRAKAQQAGFFTRLEQGRPWVTLKLATSLDGRIATASGESRWITGPLARAHVHTQRACHDAVLIGAQTARSDDPCLNVRTPGATHHPVRVVVASGLNLPTDSALTKTLAHAPLWVCHGARAGARQRAVFAAQGVRLIACASDPSGRVDTADMMAKLAAAGLTRVYCEGGSALAASLVRAGYVDRLDLYMGGKTIGAEGHVALGKLSLMRLDAAPVFGLAQTRALGDDVLHRWTRLHVPAG